MEFINTLEDMPDDVRVTSRSFTSPVHDTLATIANDPEHHRALKVLARFKLPAEKGKAHQQKQQLTQAYGNVPAISGYEFVVTRSVDNSTEYLGVVFDPSKIQPGAYEEWADKKAAATARAKERQAKRDTEKAKAKARAEIEALENAS